MDRPSEKEKSSRRTRDDRDYRDRDRDHERDHDHRSSRDHKHRESDTHHRHHHRHHHRSDREESRKHKSKRERSAEPRDSDREGSRDREIKRENSYDSRDEREGSKDRDRVYDRESKRERSYEPRSEREGSRDRDREKDRLSERAKGREIKREESYVEDGDYERERTREKLRSREESVERRHKRKERAEGEEKVDGNEKRARVSEDDVHRVTKEKRRFEDRRGKENNGGVQDYGKQVDFSDVKVKKEESEEHFDNQNVRNTEASNGGGSDGISASLKSFSKESSNVPEASLGQIHPPPTKVSSISTTHENKGVSITGSHEVPGKSSTDGSSSSAGKNGSLSLDVAAKAKKVLQMQKELKEKLTKVPLLNRALGSSSDGKEGQKMQSFTYGTTPGPSATATSGVSGVVQSLSTTLPHSAAAVAASVRPPAGGVPGLPSIATTSDLEVVKRAQEVAAKMGFRPDPQFAPHINLFPGQMPPEITITQKPTKAPVLRLDALGREIDEHGNVVNVTKPSNLSTLKVNINKQKKEAFQILKPVLEVDPENNPHYDTRMGINKNKLLRPKRMSFQFVEEGRWSKEAEMIKLKSQFGEARAKEQKAKQAQLAKAKAAPDINPNLIEVAARVPSKEKPKEVIPEVEWWDVPLIHSGTYGDLNGGVILEDKLKMEKITIYIEHPRPIEPPAEPAPPPPQPLKLTKKEQKKLRTQRRLAREKEKQEMIRQGLLEPPKPKVKLSNLMKVLGSEAAQDPTRLEKEIRSAAAEREQAHIDRNIARKLTPAERREKKERKLFDDPNTLETLVAVFKISDLSHPQTRFKVDVNAQENRMSGCAVISDGISVVVVEGGSKSMKRYKKLMLRRINWATAVKEEDEDEDSDDKPINKCLLVWEGSVAKPSFNRFSVHECMTEAAARKIFSDAGVGHYWDLAVNFSED